MRKVVDNIIINTLFGLDVDRKRCSTCENIKYVTEFYTKSVRVRNRTVTRAQCIDCWTHLKGRTWNCEGIKENA